MCISYDQKTTLTMKFLMFARDTWFSSEDHEIMEKKNTGMLYERGDIIFAKKS